MLKLFVLEGITGDAMQLVYTSVSSHGLVFFKEEDQ